MPAIRIRLYANPDFYSERLILTINDLELYVNYDVDDHNNVAEMIEEKTSSQSPTNLDLDFLSRDICQGFLQLPI